MIFNKNNKILKKALKIIKKPLKQIQTMQMLISAWQVAKKFGNNIKTL
jgi:hypothetical protein